MNCHKHYDKQAVDRCGECGQYICEECVVKINNVGYCKECVSKLAAGKSNGDPMNYGVPPQDYYTPPAKRQGGLNAFFLFCLSCVPGLNYMYLGLMKRGMFFMTMFFLIIFFTATLKAPMLMFAVFIELCYSFFDSFRLRRMMLNGYSVEDSVDDVMGMYQKYKRPIIIFVGAIFAFTFMQKIVNLFSHSISRVFGGSYWYVSDLLSFVFGVVIIVAGCYIIAKGINNKKNL